MEQPKFYHTNPKSSIQSHLQENHLSVERIAPYLELKKIIF